MAEVLDMNNNKTLEHVSEIPLASFGVTSRSQGNPLFRSPHSSDSFDSNSECSTYSTESPAINLQTGLEQRTEQPEKYPEQLTYHELSQCKLSTYKVQTKGNESSSNDGQPETNPHLVSTSGHGIPNIQKRPSNLTSSQCRSDAKVVRLDNNKPPEFDSFIQSRQSVDRANLVYRNNTQPIVTRNYRSLSCETWKPRNQTEDTIQFAFSASKENRWGDFDWNRPNQTLMIPNNVQNNSYNGQPYHFQRLDRGFPWNANYNTSATTSNDDNLSAKSNGTRHNSSFTSTYSGPCQPNRPTVTQTDIPSYPLLTNLMKQRTYANDVPLHQGPSNWRPTYDRAPINRPNSPITQPAKEIYPNYRKDVELYSQYELAYFRRLNEIDDRQNSKFWRKTVQGKSNAPYDFVIRGLPPHISPDNVFCLVPGRLGMPNHGKRHEVTVSEIVRRVLNPESLNISLLGPILRKAKSKNGSQYLRDKLQEIGIVLPQGRRKTAQCTLFTSLTESESGQLADDFSRICDKQFPARTSALCIQQLAKDKPYLTNEAISCTISLLDRFSDLMIAKYPPSPGNRFSGLDEATNDNMNRQMYNFETLTHGFGIRAVLSGLSVFRNSLSSLADLPNE